MRDGGGVLTVLAFTVNRGRITALDAVRNPDKLAAVRERGWLTNGASGSRAPLVRRAWDGCLTFFSLRRLPRPGAR